MRTLRSSLLLFTLMSVLISSCSANVSVPTPRVSTSLPETNASNTTPTLRPEPTFTPTIAPTNTLLPKNEPGLIVTLGEKVAGPWHLGIPVFSPNGQIIALANPKIRFWDVHTHQLIREIKYPFGEGCRFFESKFSPNGKYFAVSIADCWNDEDNAGQLLIWDASTGDLLQEWTQAYVKMPGPTGNADDDYNIPVSAFAFLPDNTGIVFANGNTLETRDILDTEKQDVLNLGPKMYATQLSLSSDGRVAYILMRWIKNHVYSAAPLITQYKLQIWNIITHAMIREYKYPENSTTNLELLGRKLVSVDYEQASNQILNLETEELRDLPYRQGATYYNSDGSLLVYARFQFLDGNEQGIELWRTDTWRNIYTFMPDFGPDWTYGMHDIAFSPDSKILAIEHGEQISLWNIGPVVEP